MFCKTEGEEMHKCGVVIHVSKSYPQGEGQTKKKKTETREGDAKNLRKTVLEK